MIRFIWQNWWRRKDRFILLIIGAFIVSAGLTYLIGLSETNKGTIVDTLQQEWTASYDIVVRPEGSRSVTEDKKLLEPNYLSGLDGGISIEQYHTIKDIPGVEVAAPIAMIGYAGYEVNFGNVELNEPGIYRRIEESIVDNGIDMLKEEGNNYFPLNVEWNYYNKGGEYGAGAPGIDLTVTSYALLAGIDPLQEAKLVGLDDAVVSLGTSRYFNDFDYATFNEEKEYHEIPIIVNSQSSADINTNFTFERLNLSINKGTANEVMEMIKENGGYEYLETINGLDSQTYSFTGEEVYQTFISEMTGVDWEAGEVIQDAKVNENSNKEMENDEDEGSVTWIVYKPSPLNYKAASSPFSDRWPFAYQVVPVQNDEDTVPRYANQESYREPILHDENPLASPRIKPNWIGFYDSSNLNISIDPTNELPMETYRPASAELVINSNDEPVNPPKVLKPTDNPYDFLTEPPGMLTTIEAAEQILGNEPISAIRIKVAGVTDLSDESQTVLEHVATEIENRTGLITDITLGSSPQLALTYVPGINNEPSIGWLQQPWVNIGSSISIFRETKIGFAGVVASVIAVAIVYVWASGIISVLARRKEFAVLLSVGWRPSRLSKLLVLESLILGTFVALISWMMLGFVYISSEVTISLTRFFWTGCFGFIIYLLGSVIPSLLARSISPYEAMRTGEIVKTSKRLVQTRGLTTMAFNHYVGKWKRSVLSVVSISLPTALLAVFLCITFRLQGIMYTTLLGEYLTLEIGAVHYVAIIVALIIAVLTTAEIMWQNVSERREEIALLQAIGWNRKRVRFLILLEGVISGIFAALIGLTLAFLLMWGLYGEFPTEEIGFILSTGLIPIIIGILGAILPAERAARLDLTEGMRGNYSNKKAVEKRLRWVVASLSLLLVVSFLYTMFQVAPKIEVSTDSNIEQAFSPTKGSIQPNDTGEKESSSIDDSNETNIQEASGHYLYETNEGENTGGDHLSFNAMQVDSDLEAGEKGMKHISIEFMFEVLNDDVHEIRPMQNFELIIEEEVYKPVTFSVLESEGWEEERWLYGLQDGKVKGVIEFSIPASVENYELLLKSKFLGNGILVKFD